MNKKPIILIGGGGHCKSCIDIIEMEGKYAVAGILDKPEKIGTRVLNSEIIGTDNDIPKLIKEFKYFFISIGQIRTAEKRIEIYNLLSKYEVELATIISPYAYVSKYARIGRGTIIMHQAIINAGSIIGENCIINSNALIEHDTVIGNQCHISTGAIINGSVNVGMGTFIGSGAVTNNNCKISELSFIKANSFYRG